MTTTTTTDRHYPGTAAEARRLVHYGPRTHGSRRVVLDSRATPRQHTPGWELAVRGPSRPGELLTVVVESGMIPLHVVGGNVAVILGSSWGNVCHIEPAARQSTTVEVWQGCKATVEGCDPAALTGDLKRVYWPGRLADCAVCGAGIRADGPGTLANWLHWSAGSYYHGADHGHVPA